MVRCAVAFAVLANGFAARISLDNAHELVAGDASNATESPIALFHAGRYDELDYINCGPRCWEHGSHADPGTASSPGYLPNGWLDPNSEMLLSSAPNHNGDPYEAGAYRNLHLEHDPHHCFHGWIACCNSEFNCCGNCPLHESERPEWGPEGFSQCLGWYPGCGTNASPPANLPQGGFARARQAIGNGASQVSSAARNFWGNHHDDTGFHWR